MVVGITIRTALRVLSVVFIVRSHQGTRPCHGEVHVVVEVEVVVVDVEVVDVVELVVYVVNVVVVVKIVVYIVDVVVEIVVYVVNVVVEIVVYVVNVVAIDVVGNVGVVVRVVNVAVELMVIGRGDGIEGLVGKWDGLNWTGCLLWEGIKHYGLSGIG